MLQFDVRHKAGLTLWIQKNHLRRWWRSVSCAYSSALIERFRCFQSEVSFLMENRFSTIFLFAGEDVWSKFLALSPLNLVCFNYWTKKWGRCKKTLTSLPMCSLMFIFTVGKVVCQCALGFIEGIQTESRFSQNWIEVHPLIVLSSKIWLLQPANQQKRSWTTSINFH